MDLYKDLDQKIKVAIDILKQELNLLRANRPVPQLLEEIQVEYLDQILKIKQLGSISVVPPRDMIISAWDKESIAAIIKAVEKAGAGLSASAEGNNVRVKTSALTEERRQELSKLVKASAEKLRIKIRASRDEANKKVEADFKSKFIGEDQKFKSKKQIQEVIDKANKEIDTMVDNKIKEISE